MTPKRFARTLEEAFGPGHRGGIYEPYPKLDIIDKVITGVCGVILFGLFIAIVKGWI
jgi:hypothetical protein